jgi:hypothetical protein
MLDDDAFRRSLSTAVDFMWLIEGSAAGTVAEVKEQERVYGELRAALNGKYGRLADLVTATRFGLRVDPTLWGPLADYATGRTIAAPARLQEWLAEAEAIAGQRRFFHWELEFPEVFFDRQGQPLGERAGFDAVIGNPPYVRQEQMAQIKPYLAQAHSAVYDGVADLYVYFYHMGLEMLRVGGTLSYIVTNKWLRAGYGAPLRAYFAANAEIEQIVDFGHAPIFPDADTFPCIVVLQRREPDSEVSEEATTQVSLFPREALGKVEIPTYVQNHSYSVPARRFTAQPWSLELAEVDELMAKIRRAGVPLREFIGVSPLYGLKTGLNEAFLIDTPTKERLVRDDPRCAEVIKPYLRGQDIKRWSPAWDGMWIILLKSSGDHVWPWAVSGDAAEDLFARTFPSVHRHMKPLEARLRKRQDQGRYWWELRACAYYEAFERPKLTYQEIQSYSAFGYDHDGYFANNKVFILPTGDLYLLATLNSPLIWWYNWRVLPHMINDAVSPTGVLMEVLPIARPSDSAHAEVKSAGERLITLTHQRRAAQRDVLDWLRVEFGVETPGQRLATFAALDGAAFIEEIRRRRPRRGDRLSPAALRDLRGAYEQHVPAIRALEAEAQGLERRVAELVNVAYGLTPEEVDLLWRTAPPRMPITLR